MRRTLAATVLVFVLHVAPAAAQSFVVGSGGSPGIAVDGAGTLFVAYKVDTYGPTDAVELCVVPRGARVCGIRTRIAYPGQGYNLGSVGVHLGPAGQVLVVTGRTTGGLNYPIFVRTSPDGGRTFGAPVALYDGFMGHTALLPNGRIALVGGAAGLGASAPALNGADFGRGRPGLDGFAPFQSITTLAGTAVVAGSSASNRSRAWLLAPGSDGYAASSWSELPLLDGGIQPQVSGGLAGLGALLESSALGVHFRRLEAGRWSPGRALGAPPYDDAFDLVQDARGRFIAVWAVQPINDSRTRVEAVISSDRGATWSSVARLTRTSQNVFGDDFEAAVGPDGRGAVAFFDDVGGGTGHLGPVRVVRISPGRIPVAQRRVGNVLLSLRVEADERCVKQADVVARLQASIGDRRVSPLKVVRRVRFRARAIKLGGSRTTARYRLRRVPTAISARVVTRGGRVFRLRLRTRACL